MTQFYNVDGFNGDWATINGSKYMNSQLHWNEYDSFYPLGYFYGDGGMNKSATFYVDDNGSIIYIKADKATTTTSYALDLDYYYHGGLASPSAEAKLFLSDGTMGIYNVAPNAVTGLVPDQSGTFDFRTGWLDWPSAYLVTCTTHTDGTVDLVANETYDSLNTDFEGGQTDVDGVADDYQITTATHVFYYELWADYGDYLYTDSAGVDVYNYPTVTIGFADTEDVVAGNWMDYIEQGSTGYLKAVLFSYGTYLNSSSTYAWLSDEEPVITGPLGAETYTYTVYIDGVKTTLESYINFDYLDNNELYKFILDSNGMIIAETQFGIDQYGFSADVISVSSSTLVFNGGSCLIDSNTAFYYCAYGPTTVQENPIAAGYIVQFIQYGTDGVADAVYYVIP
jgi:hypothetical protein